MTWLDWALIVVDLIVLAMAFHYYDAAKAQRGLAAYWQDRYDRERAKYRRLVESMVIRAKHHEANK